MASASIEKTASSKQEDEVVDVAQTEAREMKANMKSVDEEEPAT